MHEEYLPQTEDEMRLHVLEEAAELIVAYAKVERFGPDAYDPSDPLKQTNEERFMEELFDLEHAIARFRSEYALNRLENNDLRKYTID